MRATHGTLLAIAAIACTGQIEGSVTTDFGAAIATSEWDDAGDIDSRLTTVDEARELGTLRYAAAAAQLSGDVDGAPLVFAGEVSLVATDASLAELNAFLFALWEAEAGDRSREVCVGSSFASCCRSDAWRCRSDR